MDSTSLYKNRVGTLPNRVSRMWMTLGVALLLAVGCHCQLPDSRYNDPFFQPAGEPRSNALPPNAPGYIDPQGPPRTPNINPLYDPNNPNFVPRTDQSYKGPYDPGYGGDWYSWESNTIIREATYFAVASRMVRPGKVYTIAVTVLQAALPITVRASISRNRVEIATDSKDMKEGIPDTLLMRVPTTTVDGDYKLRLEGLYDGVLGGIAFVNETKLTFSQRSMTIFIQTDRPVYMQGQTIRFRAIPINTELRAYSGVIDLYMLDPNRHIMRRWLSRQSNLGTVSLDYTLSDQPVFGEWTLQVVAQGQIEEQKFLVEEYYQTRFEVNVTMPAFFFDSDRFIYGTVMANYTSGGPVNGNLTLKALVRPRTRPGYRPAHPRTIYFQFDESYPWWYPKAENRYAIMPHLKFFYGVYHFRYPISELLPSLPTEEGFEVTIVATVGERYLDEVIEGYSTSRIYKSRLKVSFMGGSPQVFKPPMPYKAYVVVSFHDGSALSRVRLAGGELIVGATVDMYNGNSIRLSKRQLSFIPINEGVWELKIDLRAQLNLDKMSIDAQLSNVKGMRIQATYLSQGDRAISELLLLSHYSPTRHHIKISTSTHDAKLGEYIIFHVQSNFFMETFNYVVISKGIILLAREDIMQNTIRTFAVPLSAEMAPAATIIVYHVGRYGDVVADSLTFPVNGISRNNFTVYLNNRKARTGERIEVAIYGEPGSFVGLSGIDRAFFGMQAGNELSYSKVVQNMASFDEETNKTYSHTWLSHEGLPDDVVYYPSSSFGIDANRTFEYLGLVVFSDVLVTRRPGFCNASLGFGECLDGQCYLFAKKCDGIPDCQDATDEAGCPTYNKTDIALFRKYRFSRIQRQYDNVWLWKDINIGPHGRYIFDVEVPHRPAHWMINAFSMSPTFGFGMIPTTLEYVGVLPFFMNVEMPNTCRQGEQVGIRITVFNYLEGNLEATVVLAGSRDYKFVHVEENGYVRSYNPRTSFGEHQMFLFVRAQDTAIVYIPIVPTRLGDIDVTVMTTSLIGKDVVTRKLHVEADGLPQYRHQSILLDLSNRAYVVQYMHVNITELPIIPYEEDRYYIYGSNKATISVVGDVVGPIFPTMPVNSTSLMNLPMDCAEQTIFSFAAHLYTTLYMRYTSQRNRTLERESFHYMNVLYQRQLSFMKWDGSFSLFRSDWNQSDSSVWLTAYSVRVLQEASFYEWENYIYIDPEVISKAVSWLLKHQSWEGAFYEVSWFPDRKVNDSSSWPDDAVIARNISLTAHVLITLDTVKDLTGGLGAQVALAQSKAISWLERNLKLLDRFGEPYEVAIVAYALMLSKASTAETAFGLLARHKRERDGLFYWGKIEVPSQPQKLENQKPFLLPRLPYEYDSGNIETTSYALLVYVARQELMIDRIVKWLNSQRLTDGGWASTQDSAVAMKALIEYTNRNRLRDVSQLTVTIEATSLPGQTKKLHVNSQNLAALQKIEIPEAWGTVKVQANGAGYAILQMSVQYNVDIVKFQTQPPVRAFALHTRADFHGRNQSHITYRSCQRWTNLGESARSGMAVLDVAIPTGYIIQQQKLDWYIQSRQVRNLQRARFQERKVLFYFDYLDTYDTCINFTIERWFPVANMSRYLPVRVYDYYAPERFNETIFDSLPTYLLNICEVCGSSQCPYCPIYNLANALAQPMIWTVLLPVFIALVRVLPQDAVRIFTIQ